MTEFAVFAESKATGKKMLLRRGFESYESAEDHPVITREWARVWVEPIAPKPVSKIGPPPKPWTIEWSGHGHAYVRDAVGDRIAILLGTQSRREHTAAIILGTTEAASEERQ